MSLTRKTPMLFMLVVASILPLGCGGKKPVGDPEAMRRNNDLALIYELYSQYLKMNQRPPKQLSDLNQKQFQGMAPETIRAIQNGDYHVIWGVNSKDAGAVVAYEKDADKKGGAVLMADGSVKNMTADELKAALKTKG